MHVVAFYSFADECSAGAVLLRNNPLSPLSQLVVGGLHVAKARRLLLIVNIAAVTLSLALAVLELLVLAVEDPPSSQLLRTPAPHTSASKSSSHEGTSPSSCNS